MKNNQKELIDDLYDILTQINEEGLDDDDFYEWLNDNYFFEKNLEEIIFELNKAKRKL
jgi:hypothetical protein